MTERFQTLDVIRGFAVLGILLMNIVSMGLPGYAYINPHFYGGATGADLWAWATTYAVADGKMRMLFTLLFGASVALVTDRAEQPGRVHYARMFWLFVFGMLHAWFIWYGDILVEYAIVGTILFVARKWSVSALVFAAACLVLLGATLELLGGWEAASLRAAAEMPGATAAAREAWQSMLADLSPPRDTIAGELAGYRGSVADAFAARMPMTILFQTTFLPFLLPETLGIAAFGLALYRLGFLTGEWSERSYRRLIWAGAAALLLYLPLIHVIVAARFDPVLTTVTNSVSLLLRPFVALGYASALILLVRSGRAQTFIERLAAAGRMAFSNYLGTSIVATTIFYGYGFGLFGFLSRAELYAVVLLIWTLILLWSKPWLAHFRYGPFEWLWRSLARVRLQPIRKAIATD